MAVRVRKLAKQVSRSPADTLGLLHHLGFSRYKSAEDMIPDRLAARVRSAARDGVQVPSVQPSGNRKASAEAPRVTPKRDLMSSLVPGVARAGHVSAAPVVLLPAAPAPASTAKPVATVVPVALPAIADSAPLAALVAAREALVFAEREIAQFKAQNEDLTTQVAALTATIDAAAETQFAGQQQAQDATEQAQTLGALLEQRGLRGQDEHARAVAALVSGRWLSLVHEAMSDPDAVEAVLHTRLVLVDGEPPLGLGGAVAVTVSAERAEAPGAGGWDRAINRLGESLMLSGRKHLRVIGAAVRWHGVIRSRLDSRITLQFQATAGLDVDTIPGVLKGTDVLWLWDVRVDSAAEEAIAASSVFVSRGKAGAVSALATLLYDLDHSGGTD